MSLLLETAQEEEFACGGAEGIPTVCVLVPGSGQPKCQTVPLALLVPADVGVGSIAALSLPFLDGDLGDEYCRQQMQELEGKETVQEEDFACGGAVGTPTVCVLVRGHGQPKCQTVPHLDLQVPAGVGVCSTAVLSLPLLEVDPDDDHCVQQLQELEGKVCLAKGSLSFLLETAAVGSQPQQSLQRGGNRRARRAREQQLKAATLVKKAVQPLAAAVQSCAAAVAACSVPSRSTCFLSSFSVLHIYTV